VDGYIKGGETLEYEQFESIRREQRKTLDEKIETSINAIKEGISKSKRPCVAFSGGKASLVALHLTLHLKPDVMVLFNNTTNEFHETVKYVRDLARKWKLRFYEVKPKLNYWQVVKKHGFPHQQRYKFGEPKCCQILKTDPAVEFYRKKHIDCVITGIQASESGARLLLTAQKGIIFESESIGNARLPRKIIRINPVCYWLDKDLWEYIERYNIPVNPVYEKYGIDRCGCVACTGYFGWEKELARIRPRILERIYNMMGITQLKLDEETEEIRVRDNKVTLDDFDS